MLMFVFHKFIKCAFLINDTSFLLTKPYKNTLDQRLYESVNCCNNLIKRYNATINKPKKYKQLIDSCSKKQKIINEAGTLTMELEHLKKEFLRNNEVIAFKFHNPTNTEQFKNELNVI